MDPYNPYGQPQQDPNAPAADGDRGIGKALLIGAAAATVAVAGYGVYSHVSKKKKKKVTKREISADGTSRDITVEVDCDPNDPEGYEVPEGYPGAPADASAYGGYGAPAPGYAGYGAPAPGYGAPPPGYGGYGAPAPGYGAPAPGYGAYGAPPAGYGAYGAPAPGYGAPPPGY